MGRGIRLASLAVLLSAGACGRLAEEPPAPPKVCARPAFRSTVSPLSSREALDSYVKGSVGPGTPEQLSAVGYFTQFHGREEAFTGSDADAAGSPGLAKRTGDVLLVLDRHRVHAVSIGGANPVALGAFTLPDLKKGMGSEEMLFVRDDTAFVVGGGENRLAIQSLRLRGNALEQGDTFVVGSTARVLMGSTDRNFDAALVGEELVVVFQSDAIERAEPTVTQPETAIPSILRRRELENDWVKDRPLFYATDVVLTPARRERAALTFFSVVACNVVARPLACRTRAILGTTDLNGWVHVGQQVLVGANDVVLAVDPRTLEVAMHRTTQGVLDHPLAIRQTCDGVDALLEDRDGAVHLGTLPFVDFDDRGAQSLAGHDRPIVKDARISWIGEIVHDSAIVAGALEGGGARLAVHDIRSGVTRERQLPDQEFHDSYHWRIGDLGGGRVAVAATSRLPAEILVLRPERDDLVERRLPFEGLIGGWLAGPSSVTATFTVGFSPSESVGVAALTNDKDGVVRRVSSFTGYHYCRATCASHPIAVRGRTFLLGHPMSDGAVTELQEVGAGLDVLGQPLRLDPPR